MTTNDANLRALAEKAFSEGRWDDAESLFRQAVNHLELAVGPNNFEVAATLHCLAKVLQQLGRTSESMQIRERADLILCSVHDS